MTDTTTETVQLAFDFYERWAADIRAGGVPSQDADDMDEHCAMIRSLAAERDALKAENERLAGLVKDAVAGLREAENTPEPDHHVWQFRHVMAVIGNTLAKMEKTDDHTD